MKFLIATMMILSLSKAKALEVDMSFEVSTNMPGVNFPVNLKEKVQVKYEAGKDKEIRVPAKFLTTGMDIRDEHMQEMVFNNTKNDQDIVFKVSDDACSKGAAPCSVKGEFVINGKSKAVDLAFKQEGADLVTSFDLLLTDYGLEISKMGVTVESKVPAKLRIKK
jgi:polyisoprenoid-binding protein YceI